VHLFREEKPGRPAEFGTGGAPASVSKGIDEIASRRLWRSTRRRRLAA